MGFEMNKFFLIISVIIFFTGLSTFAESSLNIVEPYSVEGYDVFENEGTFGVCDESGRIILSDFTSIDALKRKCIVVSDVSGKWGVVDTEGKIIVPIQYKRIDHRDEMDLIVGVDDDGSETLYWFENDGIKSLDLLENKLATINQNVAYRDYFVVIDKKMETYGAMRNIWDTSFYVIDHQGKQILDMPLEYVYSMKGRYGVAQTKDNMYGLLDEKANWILEPTFDYISPYDVEMEKKSFIIASKNGLFSGYDLKGNRIIDKEYTHMAYIKSDYILASADNNNSQTVLDLEGNTLITVKDLNIKSVIDIKGERYYLCYNSFDQKAKNNLGLLKADGSWLIKPEYDVIAYRADYDYLDCGKESHARYYFDLKGKFLTYIDPSNDRADGDYYVSKSDGYNINKRIENYRGEILVKGYWITDYWNDNYYLAKDLDEKYILLNDKGDILFSTDKMEFRSRVGELFLFQKNSDDSFVLLDKQMNPISDKTYTKLFSCEEIALWAYDGIVLDNYDLKGQYRFSLEYDPIEFYNGQLISQPLNNSSVGIRSSWDKVGYDPIKRYGLIDPISGTIILKTVYKKIRAERDNFYSVMDDAGKWGIVDNTGQWRIMPQYEKIHAYYNRDTNEVDYFSVQDENGKWGLIDSKGNAVLKSEYGVVSKVIDPYYSLIMKDKLMVHHGDDYWSEPRN